MLYRKAVMRKHMNQYKMLFYRKSKRDHPWHVVFVYFGRGLYGGYLIAFICQICQTFFFT